MQPNNAVDLCSSTCIFLSMNGSPIGYIELFCRSACGLHFTAL